jgi:protein-tyrosine phosphatase
VLCYGNIYRSPLVEYLLRKAVCEPNKIGIRSAGFHEKEHRSCDPEFLKLLSQRGYALQAHRSSRVSKKDIDWADLIVIMDRKNWDMLMALDSSAKGKVVWIGAFAKNVNNEIADPYGMQQGEVNKVIDQIELSVVDLANRINDRFTASKMVCK